MKQCAIFLLAGTSLLVGVSIPCGLLLAQEKVQSPAGILAPADLTAIKASGNTDPTGATGAMSPEGKALGNAPLPVQAMPPTMYACLEMLYDVSGPVMWYIDARVGPTGNIVSATVKGAICETPNWALTGSLGPTEDIVGTRTNPSVDPSCNTKITIKGSLQGFLFWEGPVPPTGIGTTSGYNFPSMGPNQWFPQTTYLRSYSPTQLSCP